jgi:sugar (pentulose or hexulose) kinase
MLVAGVDVSTQATKVLIVDPDDGAVVAVGRAQHRRGKVVDPSAERDLETFHRIRAAREATLALHEG